MNAQNKEIRLNAGRLIAYYAPLFAEQSVVLDYQLRRFTQFSPSGRDHSQRRFDKVLHNIDQWLRKLFTGKKPVPYRGDEAIAEVWALILTFSTMDKTSKKIMLCPIEFMSEMRKVPFVQSDFSGRQSDC